MAGLTSTGQPVRPYSSAQQVPAGAAFRSQEFATGIAGDPGNAASSLNQQSARWNNLTPAQFGPHSVLQQMAPSPNGESAADASRRLLDGTQLASPNGQSMSSYNASLPLRLAGQDAI
jgi:hypothetical protein